MNRLWAYHSLNHLSIQSLQDLGIRWNDEKGGFEQIPDQPTLKGYWLRCKGRRVWIQPGGSQCCFDKKCDQYYCPHGPDCEYCVKINSIPPEEELSPTLSLGSPWASTSSECWEDDGDHGLSGGHLDSNCTIFFNACEDIYLTLVGTLYVVEKYHIKRMQN